MRLASFTDYSLRVLIYLGLKEGELSTVGEISDKYQISRNHLVKVVHNLSRMGVINSYKGKNGGISLKLGPKDINIGKIIQELESDAYLLECFGASNNCIISPSCKLKGALKLAEEQFFKTLYQFSLSDILSNKKQLSKNLSLFN